MKSDPLPILISIPHGGTQTPAELEDRVIITPHDLFDDSDAYTQDIYDVGNLVVKVIKTDIARPFVDMNRAPNQMPPEFPDGLIKSSTCLLKPIYKEGKHPDMTLREKCVRKYYDPFHEKIKKWSKDQRIKLGLDCHSMLPIAPDISPDRGNERPLINLGNLDGKACPDEITQVLADAFCSIYTLSSNDVTLNRPFKGGYITKTYANRPIPWIQIEMNRILYLEKNGLTVHLCK